MKRQAFNPTQIVLTQSNWRELIEVARHAIKYGLEYQTAPSLELNKYPENIQQSVASFVTIKESNVLRGCVGSVIPHLPLVQDVANHAFAAAFQDARFAPINHIEEPVIHISISVLSALESLQFKTEQELIQQIEGLQCGVLLSFENRQATFLPDVWQEVSNGVDFLKRLKANIGLSADFWNHQIAASGYRVQAID